MSSPTAVLLLSCPDQPGIVATVAEFIWRHGGNILHADQHTDHENGVFFQRVEFELTDFDLDREQLASTFDEIADRFGMHVQLRFTDVKPRTAILTSTASHCLVDLLARWHAGELPADVTMVISNHDAHRGITEFYGLPFHYVPVLDDPPTQEHQVAELLHHAEIELVVLARYMRILSPEFVANWPERIINIHHSFLPAFIGARPYHQAHQRGVKIIGATAHIVTSDLDEGPIIEQDVTRVSHRDDPNELAQKGQDLEVTVLARALRAFLQHRVLVWGNRTIVFD